MFGGIRGLWCHSDTSGASVASYTYDGDWKRLKKVVATNATEYYYDDMQLAEIRQIGTTGQVVQTESLVYDTRYLHSVACRDIYSGTSPASLVTRHFFMNDGNFNVTALVSTNPAAGEGVEGSERTLEDRNANTCQYLQWRKRGRSCE